MKKQHGYGGGGASRPDGGVEILGANSEIGKKLREYFDGLVSEEVPDRFADLLSKLESAEAGKKGGAA